MAHGSASNFIRQTVGSSVGTNDPETIDVADASAFPDPSTSQYDIVIWDAGSHNRPDQDADVEVLTVTGRDTTNETLTCDRGQQGTSNTSHPSTSDVIVAPLSQLDVNTVDAQSITTDALDIGTADLADSGDFIGLGPTLQSTSNPVQSTTSTSYVFDNNHLLSRVIWQDDLGANVQGAIISHFRVENSTGDIKLRNTTDGEDVHEQLDVSAGTNINLGPTNYTPTTTASQIQFKIALRTNDGGSSTDSSFPLIQIGVQV